MAQDGKNDHGFATGLAKLCLRVLRSLYLQEHDRGRDREREFGLREQLHTLYLWKESFRDGRLDTALAHSDDLRHNVLDCLCEIGRIILRSSGPTTNSGTTPATQEKLIRELAEYIDQVGTIASDGAISESFTEYESGLLKCHDVVDPVDEIETQTRCLMQLSSTIERNFLRAASPRSHMAHPDISHIESSINVSGAKSAFPRSQSSRGYNQQSFDPTDSVCHWREVKEEPANAEPALPFRRPMKLETESTGAVRYCSRNETEEPKKPLHADDTHILCHASDLHSAHLIQTMKIESPLQSLSMPMSYDKGGRAEGKKLDEASLSCEGEYKTEIPQSADSTFQDQGKARGPVQARRESDTVENVPLGISALVGSQQINGQGRCNSASESCHDTQAGPSIKSDSKSESFTWDTGITTFIYFSKSDRAYLSTPPMTRAEPQFCKSVPSSQMQWDERDSLERISRKVSQKRKREDSTPSNSLSKINKFRGLGACVTCRCLREKCGPGDPCPRCLSNLDTATVWKNQPCVRERLTDAEVHKTGTIDFPNGVPKLDFVRTQAKLITIFNVGLIDSYEGSNPQPGWHVQCQRFHETEETFSKKSWLRGGQKVDLILPPYAMKPSRTRALGQEIESFVESHLHSLVGKYEVDQGDIVSMIFDEAARHMESCEALKGALSIAVFTKLTLKSFNITGDETLGIKQVDDPESPYYGRVPIPTVLDAQIDRLLMNKMAKLKTTTLSQLSSMITGDRRNENWYLILLTTLILLHNIGLIYQQQLRQKERYRKTNSVQDKMMEAWDHGAKILTWYFHAACHGSVPINMDLDKFKGKAAGLDPAAQGFLIQIQRMFQSRGPLEGPLMWISSLFLST